MDLYLNHRVSLAKADTVDVERTAGLHGTVAEQRILETAGIIEAHGPFVLDHSRLEHSVFGSASDISGIEDVLQLVHPGRALADSSKAGVHDIRDALHIWTAIRYGYQAFVTTDGAVLKSADRLRRRGTSSMRILTPSQAVSWVDDEINKEELRTARRRALEQRERL
jgi:predicted nucleic acid-binding protein